MKTPYAKPWLSHDNQLDRLQSRGLWIEVKRSLCCNLTTPFLAIGSVIALHNRSHIFVVLFLAASRH